MVSFTLLNFISFCLCLFLPFLPLSLFHSLQLQLSQRSLRSLEFHQFGRSDLNHDFFGGCYLITSDILSIFFRLTVFGKWTRNAAIECINPTLSRRMKVGVIDNKGVRGNCWYTEILPPGVVQISVPSVQSHKTKIYISSTTNRCTLVIHLYFDSWYIL